MWRNGKDEVWPVLTLILVLLLLGLAAIVLWSVWTG